MIKESKKFKFMFKLEQIKQNNRQFIDVIANSYRLMAEHTTIYIQKNMFGNVFKIGILKKLWIFIKYHIVLYDAHKPFYNCHNCKSQYFFWNFRKNKYYHYCSKNKMKLKNTYLCCKCLTMKYIPSNGD